MKDKTKKFAIGTLFAGAAGYVTGVLTAPKSGKATRKDIKDTTENAKKNFKSKLNAAHNELDSLLTTAKKNSEHLKGTVKEQASKSLNTAIETKEMVKTTLKDGYKNDRELKKAIKQANDAIKHLKKYIAQYGKPAKKTPTKK